MYTSQQQAMQGLGLTSADGLRSAGRAPNQAYSYVWDFGSVAAGSTKSVTTKISGSTAFVGYMATGFLDDGSGGAVVNRNAVQLALSANEGNFQFLPYPWDTGVGTGQQPHYFLGVQPVFAQGAQVIAQLINNTSGTVRAFLRIAGASLGA